MKTERIFVIVWSVMALGAILIIGCSRTGESEAHRPFVQEASAMKSEAHTIPSFDVIPPIDAAAPQTFETATFGLG
jgi:hypothetical protein